MTLPTFTRPINTSVASSTEVYQHTRLHAALGDLTPAEYETHWRQQPHATKPVK